MPKVIDFGVAKATGQQLTEQTLFTGFGSDRRHAGVHVARSRPSSNQLDIDTRSDIYSLGVLLYELLTGSAAARPASELEQAGMLEMLRMIREEEPPQPSTQAEHGGGPAVARRQPRHRSRRS